MIATSVALGAATLLGATGIAADAPGASAAQITRTALLYSCRLPEGNYSVRVQVTAAFAATAEAGTKIQPLGVTLAARLPSAVTANIGRLGPVAGALTVIEASAAKSATVAWPLAGPHPNSGSLLLTGTAPPAIASVPGLFTFAASSLVLTSNGIRLNCAIAGPASRRFAAVMISAAKPPGKPAGRSRIPTGCGKIKVVGFGVPTCAYLTGYSDVAKLIGAALLEPPKGKPGLVNVDFAHSHTFRSGTLIAQSTAELLYRGHHELPPVTATFLAFRFVPVTATLHLTELTSISIVSVSGITAPPYPIAVKTTTKVSVHVTNVRVNGVPLNVGPNCGTASPVTLVLIGKGENTLPPKGYTVPTGGALSGMATIPPFTNCGVTENLDPLLTGSISGRGNFVKITQGKLCGPLHPANWACPPPVPKPQR